MYDIIYTSTGKIQPENFDSFKKRFPTAVLIENLKEFKELKEKSFTKLFWVVWDDLLINENFNFDYVVPSWDEEYVHVFKNGNSYDGVNIFSKKHEVSSKELDYRFFTNSKQIEIEASTPKPYEKYIIDSYDDYLRAREKCRSDLFYIIPKEVEIDSKFDFSFYTHERNFAHVFQHMFRGDLTYTGISLVPKHLKLTEKEVTHRFLVNKKMHKTVASKVAPYDIVFISYNEPDADENYQRLLEKYPRAKRVHGVKGIHQAHIAAAKLVDTVMFWVVDGDAKIVDDFLFDYEISSYERDIVHVWRSQNPVNDLVYGYGGVKLLPTKLTINMDLSKPDMTTSISSKFKAIKVISNITQFNTDPFNTWKSAFRECCKLSSKVIDRQKNEETMNRLEVWCTVGSDRPYGKFAIEGALAGKEYGEQNQGNLKALKKINDFEWLQNMFNKTYE